MWIQSSALWHVGHVDVSSMSEYTLKRMYINDVYDQLKDVFRVHSEFCVRSMYVNRFLTILSIYLLYLLTWHGWMKKTTSPTNINKSTQKNMMFSWDVLQLTMMPGPIAKLAIRWLAFYGEETGRGPHGALVGAGHAKNGMLIYNIQWMVAKSCTSWLVVFPIIHRVSII